MSDCNKFRKEAVDRRYRLLPCVLEHVAHVNPDRVYASFPTTPTFSDGDGLRDVTFGQIIKAIDAFTWWLEDTVGRSDSFETLTYVGIDDLRYALFFFACIKTGHKALFVSTRNTTEQNYHLLKITQCQHLFHSSEYATLAGRIATSAAAIGSLCTREVEPIDHWLAVYNKPYPYNKTFEEARYDPVVVLHSSGSTGPPKAIIENHQFFINTQRVLPSPDGRRAVGFNPFDYEGGGFFYSSFPFCHLGGVLTICIYPVYARSASVLLGPSGRPATAETALRLLCMRPVRTFFSPPSIIEGLIKLPEAHDYLKRLDYIIFAGGPLAKSSGDMLSQFSTVCSSYGSTETGTVNIYEPKPSDWQYLEFHPAMKTSFEEEIDGTHELVLYRDKDADEYRPIGGTIMRTETTYRTKDMFIRHPERPQLWRFYGRKDDIVVFSNGQKWNPVPSEGHILSRTDAEGVLIVGNGRTEPALLVEMRLRDEEESTALDKVWLAIEEANSQTQRYGRISRSRVCFVEPGSFLRTPIGTIVRRTSIQLLQDKVDRLYQDYDNANADRDDGKAREGSKHLLPSDILEIARTCVHQIQTISNIEDEEDLFVAGLDSLEAAELARSLKSTLQPYFGASGVKFLSSSHFIFENPSISWLTKAITGNVTGAEHESQGRSEHLFAELLTEYQAVLTNSGLHASSNSRSLETVAITGTTGSLGAQILEVLLKDNRVSRVICLNRSPSAQSHFQAANPVAHDVEVSFLTVNFTKPNIGLSESNLKLLENANAIIHCAWEVNFNRSLMTFEPQISALTDLIKISLAGTVPARLFFVSSISAASEDSLDVRGDGTVPESLVTEPGNTSRMGYAVSKNVGEHLLAFASKACGLPATILRIGQIAGSTPAKSNAPAWNRREWLPSLVDTSYRLGQLPQDQPAVDWIPVDIAAQTVIDIATHDIPQTDSRFTVYNIVNPQHASWTPLASAISACFDTSCELVPFQQWLKSLKKHDDGQKSSLERYPSLKILPFYERNSTSSEAGRQVSTSLARKISPTLAALSPIDEAQMKNWMAQWGYGRAART